MSIHGNLKVDIDKEMPKQTPPSNITFCDVTPFTNVTHHHHVNVELLTYLDTSCASNTVPQTISNKAIIPEQLKSVTGAIDFYARAIGHASKLMMVAV